MKDFSCPICGSKEFTELWSSEIVVDAPGLHLSMDAQLHCEKNHIHLGYMCRGCTVKFEDPEKFSKQVPMSNVSVDHALDVIYDCIYNMAAANQFEELDFILQYLNTKDMPTEYLLGVATATLPCKSNLIQRKGFMDRVEIALIERSENNVELLKGLL